MFIGMNQKPTLNNCLDLTNQQTFSITVLSLKTIRYMHVVIVTGGSKGIGKALAEKYTSEKHTVFSLSRSISGTTSYTEIAVDLSSLEDTVHVFNEVISKVCIEKLSSVILINNAGRLGEISPLARLSPSDIAESIHLNTITPLVLSGLFIKALVAFKGEKSIINISSGAALNAYSGWSVYCTSKAALDMLTASIAKEQSSLKNGVKSYGIRPGVVDTKMQSQIRSTKSSDFETLQRFIDLKENGQLYSPEFVANAIYNLQQSGRLLHGETIDIRDIL